MNPSVEVAVGVLVEQRDGCRRILIARRPERAVLGGYWEFPGGKLEAGEDARQCLAREFMEELGLEVGVEQGLPRVEHAYPHGRVRLWPFVCTRVAGEPRNIEVTEHRWVRPDQLREYVFPPANQALVEHLAGVFGGVDDHTPVHE